jgi:hypothetical protein
MLSVNLVNVKKYKLNKGLNLLLLKKSNIFLLKTLLGIVYFYLPSYFFFKNNEKQISLIFLKNFFFKSFIAHFFNNYLNLYYLYIVRLKIKGLGYQIHKIADNLYSFHYQVINYFYLFLPLNIITY